MGGGTSGIWPTEKRPSVPKLPTLLDQMDDDESNINGDIIADVGNGEMFADGLAGARANQEQMRKCDCCGTLTIPIDTRFTVCSFCGWQDDPEQKANPYLKNKSNRMSLQEAHRALAEGRKIN
jgi:hypothetical protein